MPRVSRVTSSLWLQATASWSAGLVGLGFPILVLFSALAFASSSSPTAKTDGQPIDQAAEGSVWGELDDFGTADIGSTGSPMQVGCGRAFVAQGRAFFMHAPSVHTSVALTVTDLGVQAASPPSLPKTASLSEKLAHAEQSAAEWAARYTGEAARVDELAKRNAALADQIANLTSLLTACTGAQSPLPAEASTAAAFVVGPPSTAAPPEASTAVYPLRRSGL